MVKGRQNKKAMTIDELARITQKGFEGVGVEIKDFREEVKDFKQETRELFDKVETRLGTIEAGLNRIENRFVGAHENRIERLEDDMRVVKTTLKIGK